MQKTETYKLNLIEMDDTFSPQPLNENAQKLEAALAGAESGLDQRLAAIEAHKLVTGSYTGNDTSSGSQAQTIRLGFDPALLLIHNSKNAGPFGALALPGTPVRNNFVDIAKLVPGGFAVMQEFNQSGMVYNYFAFA